MKNLLELNAWIALQEHFFNIKHLRMREMFQYDSGRAEKYTYELNEILFDFSKNRINFDTFSHFVDLTKSLKIHLRIKELFSGGIVNNTEQRAALHTHLRSSSNNVESGISEDQVTFIKKAEDILSKDKYNHIVQLGIGGSYIGPKMVNEALGEYSNNRYTIDYLANVDDASFEQIVDNIDAKKTLFIVATKSLGTSETQYNFNNLLSKLGLEKPNDDFLCVTSNVKKAKDLGFIPENILHLDEAIGGRYSIWSSIGLTIALNIGISNFKDFLRGAEKADNHFSETEDYFQNIPMLLAFINVWYRNFFDLRLRANAMYSDRLKYLPEYLQQLEMESLGKLVDKEGNKVKYATGGTLIGNVGTNCQHSFFQMIHQGVDIIPVDFVAIADSNKKLISNCFAQSRALMMGREMSEISDEKEVGYNTHKFFPGNIPSNTFLFKKLSPSTLGTYLAIQEHKVFVQSVIWDINPYDQFGVELGKSIANEIEGNFDADAKYDFDSSTISLIDFVNK